MQTEQQVVANPQTNNQPGNLGCETVGIGWYHPHSPSSFIIIYPEFTHFTVPWKVEAKNQKEASIRKSANSRRRFLCLVTLTFDWLTPEYNGFPGLVAEHVYVKFDNPSCIGFWENRKKQRW